MVGAFRQATLALVVLVLAVLLAAGLGGTSGAARPTPGSGSAEPVSAERTPTVDDDRPNLVLVMTDDQNADELRWMPLTRAALQEQGMSFEDAVSPHPLCCPARAQLVTGQYAQNNGVRHNKGAHGGYQALDPTDTLGSWFTRAGYQTGFVGKYLNGYGPRAGDEPGWTRWDALVRGVYSYRDFTFSAPVGGRRSYRDSYVTEEIEQRTNRLVRDFALRDQPFLLMSWHVAPHYRFDAHGRPAPPPPADQDRGRFRRARPPSFDKPSFAEPRAERPQFLRQRHQPGRAELAADHRGRLRSLQAVDRAIASLVRTLRGAGELENTYLVFTSDNGYSLGEHRFVGKNVLTEEALRVPLLVRGPGIEPGSTSGAPVSLVDLPATLADLAGVRSARVLDGASLRPQLEGEEDVPFRDTTLVQTGRGAGDGWAYRGVRTERYLYAARTGGGDDAVLYDRLRDPYELVDRAEDPAYAQVREELESRRRELLRCAGEACNQRFGPVPDPFG